MERLVLGYDGSPAAIAALSWTAARCARSEAKVDVINVVSPHTKDRAPAIQRLADAEEFLRDRIPSQHVELHRLEGSMPDTLSGFAGDVDLVIVGINTGHPVRAALAGWIPLRLALDSTAPVCMVPGGWVERGDPVTVGIADDARSDAALDFGSREARSTSTSLRLVHSWLMPTPSSLGSTALAVAPQSEMARHRRILDDAIEQVLDEHPTLAVESELIRDSRSAALLKFASSSSMLVMGAQHRGILAGGLLGSVAQEVLWRAECPICLVPDAARGEVSP